MGAQKAMRTVAGDGSTALSAPNEGAAFERAVQQGVADADAGDVVAYEDVRRWLLSWGTDNETPPPRCASS